MSMNLIYPKTCPAWLKKAIDEAVPLASEFLINKYGDIFANVHVMFQPNAVRSRYYPNKTKPHKVFGLEPVATISCHSKLYLYTKKTLGKYKDGINVGPIVQIACSIIHELTHHYQYVADIPKGELLTTANELAFLKVKFPEWYKLIMISN
jgi:hypothetical protein